MHVFLLSYYYLRTLNSSLLSSYTSLPVLVVCSFLVLLSFNYAIDSWDTSKVTDMSYTFYRNSEYVLIFLAMEDGVRSMLVIPAPYHHPIVLLVLLSKHHLRPFFLSFPSFDQPIDSWDTSNVETFEYTFAEAGKYVVLLLVVVVAAPKRVKKKS